jgi:hypothetical protein
LKELKQASCLNGDERKLILGLLDAQPPGIRFVSITKEELADMRRERRRLIANNEPLPYHFQDAKEEKKNGKKKGKVGPAKENSTPVVEEAPSSFEDVPTFETDLSKADCDSLFGDEETDDNLLDSIGMLTFILLLILLNVRP